MLHTLALSTMLSGFWMVTSGHYTPLILFFMVVSVVFVVILCTKMDIIDSESQPLNLTFTIPGYWIWLIKDKRDMILSKEYGIFLRPLNAGI